MPTGYTAKLDDNDLDTKTWIMEGLARNFGICARLREDSSDLTEEQILEKLKGGGMESYHQKAMRSAEESVAKYEKMSDEDWMRAMEEENTEFRANNERRRKEATEIRKRHARTLAELKKVIGSDVGQITQNIARFGVQQLELVGDERDPWIQKEHESVDVFKADTIAKAQRDISYHKKEQAEEEERNRERVEAYNELREDIDRILG